MSCSGSTTSSEMTEEDKAEAGISPGLLRMSLGYTGTTEQRWRQLQTALERLGFVGAGHARDLSEKASSHSPGSKAS
jgi:methionine-gamma-lyase